MRCLLSHKVMSSAQVKSAVRLYGSLDDMENLSDDPSNGPHVGFCTGWAWKTFSRGRARERTMSPYEAASAFDQRGGIVEGVVAEKASQEGLAKSQSNRIRKARDDDSGHVEYEAEDRQREQTTKEL